MPDTEPIPSHVPRPSRFRFLGPIAIVVLLMIPALGSLVWLAPQSSIESALPDASESTSRADRVPEGPNRELFVERCISCHSAAVIFRHPHHSETAWTAIVHRMILARNAKVEPGEVRPIVEYLLAVGSSAGLR